MKTVHAWLTEVDASQLINEYFCEYPIEYENFCHLEKPWQRSKRHTACTFWNFWKCYEIWK